MDASLPDREWLERAFNRIRRDEWSLTLDEYIADPIHAKILGSYARWLMTNPQGHPLPKPPNLPRKSASRWAMRPGEIDQKSRAAGERGDD